MHYWTHKRTSQLQQAILRVSGSHWEHGTSFLPHAGAD